MICATSGQVSASQFFSDAADALAREQDDVAAGALSAAADAVSRDYPHIATATRTIRNLSESCNLTRRLRIAAIVDCQRWARDFAEPDASVASKPSATTVVPCICGCGETAIVFEGDDTFYQEGQTDGDIPDESLRRYAERKMREGATMVPASDDWYPCFPRGLVAVQWFRFLDGKGWRVCVWGADDTGMERDFFGEGAEDAARRCRQRFPVVLDRDTLRDMGFRTA